MHAVNCSIIGKGKLYILLGLLFLGQFIYPASVLAQKSEAIYGSSFKTGDSIYVITNRLPDRTNSISFLNEIKPDNKLIYLKVLFEEPDTLITSEMTSSEFLSEVSSVQNDWLLFVHGDSKTYEQAVMRGMDMQYLHKVNIIVFSWPSKDTDYNGVKNFKNSKQHVIESMTHFEALMRFMKAFRQSNKAFSNDARCSMFIHSLGNYYIENMIKNQIAYDKPIRIFDNVIMNAAAVNQDHHKEWLEKFKHQEQIYVTSNKQDFNLKGVRIFTKDGKQLGEKIEHPLADNAEYIQFTEAVGFRMPTGTTHTYFIGEVPDESQNIRAFYTEVMHGLQPDLSDTSRYVKREDGLGYDIVF